MKKDTRPFYHELTKLALEKLKTSNMTIGKLREHYRQPEWCGYPDALSQMMGCWSLCFPPEWHKNGRRRNPITRERCGKCEFYIKKTE